MATLKRNSIHYGSAATLGWLLFIIFIALLPIVIFRDFTPSNELRYLSIADESLATGRWWAFTNHGIPYADKPPLYLWCIILGKWLFGAHCMWFYSLFSIIPGFVIAAVMYRWTAPYLSHEFRSSSLLMLFSCGLFAGMMFTLRMDMLMTMFIVLSFRQFQRLTECSACAPDLQKPTPSIAQRLIFAVWIFLAVFSKGPMGILIPLVATTVWLFLTRRMRLWTRAWGWPTWILLILLCAGWFSAVYAEGGTEYLDNLLVHQTVGRAVNSFHHKRPFWYYLISLTYTLQPWAFLIFGSIVYGIRKYKRTDYSLENFFLIIILSTFVLLSVISSKLQVYMLPAYPFFVYLTAIICARHQHSRLAATGVAIPAIILILAGIGAAFPGLISDVAGLSLGAEIMSLWAPLAAAILIIGPAITLRELYSKHRLSRAISWLSLTVLALVFIAGFAMRHLNSDIGYGKLSDAALTVKGDFPHAEIMTWKIDRPENIDVYLTETPFCIIEAPDSVNHIPFRSLPAIVMTEVAYCDEVPYVKRIEHVGSRFVVLYCDTTTN